MRLGLHGFFNLPKGRRFGRLRPLRKQSSPRIGPEACHGAELLLRKPVLHAADKRCEVGAYVFDDIQSCGPLLGAVNDERGMFAETGGHSLRETYAVRV